MSLPPDAIHIANLELSVRIGVSDREQSAPQRLSVSLTLHPAQSFLGLGDRIEHTINYSEVCAVVRRLATDNPPCRLIETFAGDIAAAVLESFPMCTVVEVELRKYVLPDTDYVAVHLARQRTTQPS